jgi:hypothetical protein
VQATHRPLLAQTGPFRPVQSVSAAHFAHRLFKHSGLCGEQSLSVLQVPGPSTVGASGILASGWVLTDGASGTVASGASGRFVTAASGGVAAGASGRFVTAASGGVAAGASGRTGAGARSGSGPSGPDEMITGPSAPTDTGPSSAPPAVSERPRPSIFSGPSLPPPPTGTQRKSAVQAKPGWHISAGGEQTLQSRSPAPAASVDPWLSTATRPSVPLSGSKQRQSSVQTYPGLQGALGAQTSQSRFTQESPIVPGKTSARTIERTKRRFFMFEILGRGLRKLREKWTREWPGQERSFVPIRHTGSAVGRRLARRA